MPPADEESGTEHVADLHLAPNESSGLLRVDARGILRARGWDTAFWSVLDEADAGQCTVLIGHQADAPTGAGWESSRLRTRRTGDEGRADDAEALARHDGWVYLFGSQHGGKEGPIRAREAWVARFREDGADACREGVELEVARTRFLLHRLVNDALHDSDIRLLPMGDEARAAFIEATRERLSGGEDQSMVRADDWTINVEGAEFTADGLLLLGLRYPVTADGRPILVGLRGCHRLFAAGAPEVVRLWELDAVGRGGRSAGVRDLCLVGEALHVVTGNLDSKGKGSVILADHPHGRATVNTHFVVDLTLEAQTLTGRVVREFPDHPRIEGIAEDGRGRFFYVSDQEGAVHLRCTPLLGGRGARV